MAKKGKTVPEEPTAIGAATEYSESTWSGRLRYSCNQCAYDVLEERVSMLEHLMNAHGSMWALNELIKLEKAEAPAAITQSESIQPAMQPEEVQEIYEIDLKEDQDAKNSGN